jgi:uncharacterized protein YjiS (DUF1127 family)
MPHPSIFRTLGVRIASASASVSATAAHRLGRIAQIRRNHRDVHFLLSLDDRALRDIGLTRNDVQGAASLPFWRDPGPALLRAAPFRHPATQSLAGAPSIVPAADEFQSPELHAMLFF